MGTRFRVPAAASVLCALLAAMPAGAHHGWSGNDDDITVSGVVETALSLSGPHGTMQIRDAEGRLWHLTLAPAPRTHRAGLREGMVPEGAEVTVQGDRNRDAGQHEIKVRRVTFDGTHYDVYPPRRG